jgi:hypothetical protein
MRCGPQDHGCEELLARISISNSRPKDNVLPTAAASNAPVIFLSAELGPEMNRLFETNKVVPEVV